MCEDFKQFQLKTGSVSSKSKWWAEKGYDAQMQALFMPCAQASRPLSRCAMARALP
jgi:hypothetical protein